MLWITAFSGLLQAEESDFEPRMVLIIDDMGYNLAKGEAALALPGAVTYSILPYTPYAKRFAQAAHESGREVMLHVPMANTRAKALGPGALTVDMQRDALQAGLNEALDATPYVSGVNNHMGSLLTSMEEPMSWVMETLKARDLYFIDSLTTVKTVGWKKAREAQVPYLKRHVFLDHQIDEAFIDGQFKRALGVAERFGFVVVIGHPYPETSSYLAKTLPTLRAKGIRLVPASSIVNPSIKRYLTERAQNKVQLAVATQVSSEQQGETVTD
ncbi:divergent polysaccharide deacetylase family protein [Pontibacterium granulatum]|uniref:divergent polysaccharide deacetylase family protein n=1 Tax=Pontibacterium granulatum TaxID=2036029 RepID=UPI00249A91EB|nr:divergent polysaccharide deacetylase family protein [Pontibacterium granulatum]MDI3325716.1 divergent polysaccharide deacetylase family protein [Pontibacterium granulatum]